MNSVQHKLIANINKVFITHSKYYTDSTESRLSYICNLSSTSQCLAGHRTMYSMYVEYGELTGAHCFISTC